MANHTDEQIQDTLERENLTLAPISARLFAMLIDFVVLAIVLALVVMAVHFDTIMQLRDTQTLLETFPSLLFQSYLIESLYHWLFVYYYGATLGKMACKIQVIDIKLLDTPNLWQSLLRAILRTLSQILYYIPYAFALGDELKRTLYDRAAKTLVINQKH